MQPDLQSIGQVFVAVGDLGRATAFYRDVLGLPFLFEAPPGMSFFDCGGTRLMLAPAEGEGGPYGTSILYYRVADIGATAAALEARGVVFESRPHRVARLATHTLWLAFFRDSEGNLLALMSEGPLEET